MFSQAELVLPEVLRLARPGLAGVAPPPEACEERLAVMASAGGEGRGEFSLAGLAKKVGVSLVVVTQMGFRMHWLLLVPT
jgi:hypothetical protein